jgi:hypothetical protein
MVPLESFAVRQVQSWLGEPRVPGLLDLYHALAFHRRGLWGDRATEPRSVLLVREAERRLEVFGAGEPEPAVEWLARQGGRSIALLAPTPWWDVVERRIGFVERVEMLTLSARPASFKAVSSSVVLRRLCAGDSAMLVSDVAPEWALFGWRSFHDLIENGVGFVVPFEDGIASMAWVYSQAGRYEAIGVSTRPRFRRLGLGRAAASALACEIVHQRGRIPIWTTTAGNTTSHAMARSLGFTLAGSETVLRWRPGL